MSAYNKLFAAILSTILMRLAMRYFDFDAVAFGVDEEIRALVSLAMDALVAGLNGFFVWLVPNKQES